MTKTEFINRVLLIMNEAGMTDAAGQSLIGADSAQVDKYIEGSYENAWRILANLVPKQWLNITAFKTIDTMQVEGCDVPTYILPADFFSLVRFKLPVWRKSVFEASYENDRTANVQSNPYTRGSEIRPVCVIGMEYVDDDTMDLADDERSGLVKVIRCYSAPLPQDPPEGEYIKNITPLTSLLPNASLDLSTEIIEPLSYVTAACVFTIFGNDNMAQRLTERGMLMIPGYKSTRSGSTTFKQ